ncbi:MAG: TusE/DsrC/DsvC family sulfur relay protein [Thiobacillus sp.]|nr:TusE/DsrC/DsvC family sulfur relay protein [Thiobacillus sp.]
MTHPILAAAEGRQLIRNHYGDWVELDDWSHEIARDLARAEGIKLNKDHLRVLDWLRDYVIDQGGSREDARHILLALEARFTADGGGQWLYTLFPGGPVRVGMKLAGLPEAPHDADPSFGSVR